MNKLDQRKANILNYVIEAYLQTMQPVGSRTLTRKYDLSISAATIRNEMFDLEEMGYVMHPHTSAGRIPTDKGYRYYVDYLLSHETIPAHLAKKIKNEFKEQLESIEDLIEKTSHIVATLSQETCIAVLFRPNYFLFKQIDLVLLDARRILVIWITTSGLVQNDIIDLSEEITEEYLQKISCFLNAELVGLPLEQIESTILQKLSTQRDSVYRLYQWANMIVKATLAKNKNEGSVCLEGRSYLFEKPEFHDIEKTKRLLQILEDKHELFGLLRHDNQSMGLRVLIGKENLYQDLWDCSLISASYSLRDLCIGTINILGPKRICYSRIISLLQYMSNLMTEKINKLEIN